MRPLTKLPRGALLSLWMLTAPVTVGHAAAARRPAPGTDAPALVAAASAGARAAEIIASTADSAAPLAANTRDGDSPAASDLGPTTAPPWNPPHAVARQEPWEAAVR